ncbi:MAG: 4-alpha-glucanotransferase [Rikenellaceae bacterium]
MQIFLEIEYSTKEGEYLVVEGDLSVAMSSDDGVLWRAVVESNELSIKYKYRVLSGERTVRREWRGHTLLVPRGVACCRVSDGWQSTPEDLALYSSLFTRSLHARCEVVEFSPKGGCVTLEARCAGLSAEQSLAVVGSSESLGEWGAGGVVVMADSEAPVWRATLEVNESVEYKFVIVNRLTHEILEWEQGANRVLKAASLSKKEISVVAGLTPHFEAKKWKGVGVAVPIFSLRSEKSQGVGDFDDLRTMVDWAHATGQNIIQILPINDTTMNRTWQDSYPYNANSTIALHAQYLSLRRVGRFECEVRQATYEAQGEILNALPEVDYEAVNSFKESYLRGIYEEQGAALLKSSEFKHFLAKNSWWLEPYALFSILRDKYETPDFWQWGDESKYSDELLKSYSLSKRSKSYKQMGYYYFVQYHLHVQLSEAHDYARSQGVALKGDIPIGISRSSVEAWAYPDLFNMNSAAGAPPDPFSAVGQNWGFPTYNWEAMARDDYAWWRARFEKMAEYFDAYRIDHILGFFRIWEIPLHSVHGLLGYFNPALPLSVAEIEAYGFKMEPSHLCPYITDAVLEELFGHEAPKVAKQYFAKGKNGAYRFKPKYNTQRKVAQVLDIDSPLREPILSLHSDLLFIEDPQHKGCYHPRILAQSSFAFKALSESDKAAFNAIHDDFYYRRHNDFWRDSAMKKLPMLLEATDMLVCGEDLGMIPASVPEVMNELRILSLEIERMPKAYGVEVGDVCSYPYSSVCTTSTHDMNPLRNWWCEDRELTQRYYNNVLGQDGCAPEELTPELAQLIVERHIASPSMWCILPLQDWLAMSGELRSDNAESERINIPANPRHYWRYRMHLTLERLLESVDYNQKLKSLSNL